MNTTTDITTFPSRSLVDLLRERFSERKERNSAYSLTSFARDLGVSKSILSRILSGQRPISVNLAMQLTAVLDLDESLSKAMILSVVQAQSKNAKISKKLKLKMETELKASMNDEITRPTYTTIDTEQFKSMANWYHLAILNLTKVKGFKSEPRWIAKRLGISSIEARDAIERLLALGLLTETEQVLSRTQKNLYIKTQKF